MLGMLAINMFYRIIYDFVHQLKGYIEIHPAFFNTGNREQIFHKADQPFGILKNIGVDLFSGFPIQLCTVAEQIACVAGNRGQRCS